MADMFDFWPPGTEDRVHRLIPHHISAQWFRARCGSHHTHLCWELWERPRETQQRDTGKYLCYELWESGATEKRLNPDDATGSLREQNWPVISGGKGGILPHYSNALTHGRLWAHACRSGWITFGKWTVQKKMWSSCASEEARDDPVMSGDDSFVWWVGFGHDLIREKNGREIETHTHTLPHCI